MKTTELVKTWLSNEGFRYEIDEDGDLKFRYQGANLWVMQDPNDALFLRIAMPYIYEVDNDRAKVLEAINGVNAEMKVVKGFVLENGGVWLSKEMYIDSSPDIEDFLERCLDILLAGQRRFYDKYRSL